MFILPSPPAPLPSIPITSASPGLQKVPSGEWHHLNKDAGCTELDGWLGGFFPKKKWRLNPPRWGWLAVFFLKRLRFNPANGDLTSFGKFTGIHQWRSVPGCFKKPLLCECGRGNIYHWKHHNSEDTIAIWAYVQPTQVIKAKQFKRILHNHMQSIKSR